MAEVHRRKQWELEAGIAKARRSLPRLHSYGPSRLSYLFKAVDRSWRLWWSLSRLQRSIVSSTYGWVFRWNHRTTCDATEQEILVACGKTRLMSLSTVPCRNRINTNLPTPAKSNRNQKPQKMDLTGTSTRTDRSAQITSKDDHSRPPRNEL